MIKKIIAFLQRPIWDFIPVGVSKHEKRFLDMENKIFNLESKVMILESDFKHVETVTADYSAIVRRSVDHLDKLEKAFTVHRHRRNSFILKEDDSGFNKETQEVQ